MNHEKLNPKCVELSERIRDKNPSKDKIDEILKQDPELQLFLKELESWDGDAYPIWSNNIPPLHMAVVKGRSDLVDLFFRDYSFNLESREIWKGYSLTPIHTAIWCNRPGCLDQLLKLGADVNAGGICNEKDFSNALELAEMCDLKDIQEMLKKEARGERHFGRVLWRVSNCLEHSKNPTPMYCFVFNLAS